MGVRDVVYYGTLTWVAYGRVIDTRENKIWDEATGAFVAPDGLSLADQAISGVHSASYGGYVISISEGMPSGVYDLVIHAMQDNGCFDTADPIAWAGRLRVRPEGVTIVEGVVPPHEPYSPALT